MAARSLWRDVPARTVPIAWHRDRDQDLMRRLQNADGRALEVLFTRHSGPLSHFFYRLTGDADAVDDLIQETFLRIYRARATWNEVENFITWLYTIARRLVYDRARSRRRKPLHRAIRKAGPPGATTTLLGKIPDNAPTPCRFLSRMELEVTIDRALQSIPRRYREILVLCDMQQLSYSEAAKVIGSSSSTVGTRLGRARKRLKVLLAPHFEKDTES